MNVLLRSAKIIDKDSQHHLKVKDILIQKGVIVKIASQISPPKGCREVKLDNLHVSQGWFDSSVCLGEPGYEERETLLNGLEVAAKSGFTKIALNPYTEPCIDNKSAVEFLTQKSGTSPVHVYPIANLTQHSAGKELAELYDMKNSGAIAFGDYNHSLENVNLLKIALLYAQNFNGLVLSFPLDRNIGKYGFVNESENNTRLGLNSVPNLAEELQIARDLAVLEYTGGRLHIPTISTGGSVKLIKEAKRKNLKVSCSVAAHHLVLNDSEIQSFDTNFKVTPPLRSEKDVKALVEGVENGTIDMIVSDHNPMDVENKKVEFENSEYGSIGMESLFGGLNKSLDIETLIYGLTKGPSQVFEIPTQSIAENQPADLTLFNPEPEYVFETSHILSKSKNAAFLGKQMKGKAYGIFAKDTLVLNE